MAKNEKKVAVANESKRAVVSPQVGNYEKHPFFVKKKEQAKAYLKKAGLPAVLVKKAN